MHLKIYNLIPKGDAISLYDRKIKILYNVNT